MDPLRPDQTAGVRATTAIRTTADGWPAHGKALCATQIVNIYEISRDSYSAVGCAVCGARFQDAVPGAVTRRFLR